MEKNKPKHTLRIPSDEEIEKIIEENLKNDKVDRPPTMSLSPIVVGGCLCMTFAGSPACTPP